MKFNITIQDIRDKDPCYDPIKYLPENWSGTLIDVLDVKEASFEDRLWVVTHFLGDKLNRLFAVYCARQALALTENHGSRSTNAVDVAEKYTVGIATKDGLVAARAAAWDAARVADLDDVWDDFECYLRVLIEDELGN